MLGTARLSQNVTEESLAYQETPKPQHQGGSGVDGRSHMYFLVDTGQVSQPP